MICFILRGPFQIVEEVLSIISALDVDPARVDDRPLTMEGLPMHRARDRPPRIEHEQIRAPIRQRPVMDASPR